MSNVHGYTPANMLAQFPPVLAEDERMHALAVAIVHALAVRLDELPLEEIYIRIDELPEPLLDILAVDFAVDWWDGDWSLESKRQSLKDSWKIHRILGTPDAINMAVRSAFGAGNVEEWFGYGGKAHHFKIKNLSLDALSAGEKRFMWLLNIVKRESSVLDAVVVGAEGKMQLYTGVAERMCIGFQIGCTIPPDLDIDYLTDENGVTLTDEEGNRYIDNEEGPL